MADVNELLMNNFKCCVLIGGQSRIDAYYDVRSTTTKMIEKNNQIAEMIATIIYASPYASSERQVNTVIYHFLDPGQWKIFHDNRGLLFFEGYHAETDDGEIDEGYIYVTKVTIARDR